MPSAFSELLSHRIVQIALAAVGLILAGSIAYYLIESAPPKLTYASAAQGSIAESITGSGVVTPVENPDLSFAAGGRVAAVNVRVGQKVSAGTVLASLDTGVLAASLESAQAKLDELIAGPRAVDVAGAQASLAGAESSLDATLRNAEAQAETAVAATDPLYTTASTDPQLAGLLVSDYDTVQHLDQERRAINTELSEWRSAASAGTVTADETLTHLRSVQAYLDDLSALVTTTKATTDTATLTADQTAVNGARSTVNGLVLAVSQANSAVSTANAAANLATAGARPEDIDAERAQVASIAAQLRQEEVIAPFSGTVGSVNVKAGDVVSANTTAISLVPSGAFEVAIYVSEVEMTKLSVGDHADVTLDAYGAGRIFPATVSVIDQAPSSPDAKSAPGYKVTLVFDSADPAIAVGMHANATIKGGAKDAALLIPRSALIEDGASTYVLKRGPNGPVKTPVTVGLINSDSAEIVSGLAAGDQVARAGTN